jgi:hypothetical protein
MPEPSVATWQLNAGTPIKQIQENLGHADLGMLTNVYFAHHARRPLREHVGVGRNRPCVDGPRPWYCFIHKRREVRRVVLN